MPSIKLNTAVLDESDAQVIKDFEEAYNTYSAALQELLKTFRKSAVGRALKACHVELPHRSMSPHEAVQRVARNEGVEGFTVHLKVNGVVAANPFYEGNTPSPRQDLFIGDKTVNALIHTNLLKDSEKRKLVNRLAPGVLDLED